MENWFISPWDQLWPILTGAIALYVGIIAYTRIAGKRSFSKMSSFDFAVTIAIGSVFASGLILKNVSVVQALVGLGALYLLQMSIAILRRFNWMDKLVQNEPVYLMTGTEVLHENLKRTRVSLSDLKAKLREANVLHRNDVLAVVFESTGDISVLHQSSNPKELDPWLMEGVA